MILHFYSRCQFTKSFFSSPLYNSNVSPPRRSNSKKKTTNMFASYVAAFCLTFLFVFSSRMSEVEVSQKPACEGDAHWYGNGRAGYLVTVSGLSARKPETRKAGAGSEIHETKNNALPASARRERVTTVSITVWPRPTPFREHGTAQHHRGLSK